MNDILWSSDTLTVHAWNQGTMHGELFSRPRELVLPEGARDGDEFELALHSGTVRYAHQQDAHVDAFRKWENEWYGPQGKGPNNLGSGRCLHDELSEFYRRCASHALVSGDKNMIDRFLKACWAPVNEQGGGGRLPAVNGDFVLTLKPHQE